MKILLVLALALTAINAKQCPHPDFLAKHFCQMCTDVKDAIQKSKDANKVRQDPSNLNSVLMARRSNQVYFNWGIDQDTGRCKNNKKIEVWECDIQANTCTVKGPQCTTYHDPINSHMFYDDTDCS